MASVNRGFCSELANTWLETDRGRERKRREAKAGGKGEELKGESGNEKKPRRGTQEQSERDSGVYGEKTSEIK